MQGRRRREQPPLCDRLCGSIGRRLVPTISVQENYEMGPLEKWRR
jgi:hypothetical protein